MNTQVLVYGFIGLAGFTLVTIGAWQGTSEIWMGGVSLLTYLAGHYTDSTVKALKGLKK